MRKAIINISNGWKCLDCRSTCTREEQKACPHFDCMRRNLKSEGGVEACPYIKNGLMEINEEYSKYIEQ